MEALEDLVLPPGAATPYLGLLASGLLGMAGRYEFAVLLALFFGVRLAWPRAFALELDPLGFSYRPFLHRRRFAWRRVKGFRVRRFRLLGVVFFRSVVFETEDGGIHALPEGYRLGPERLAAFLNEYRATALGMAPGVN